MWAPTLHAERSGLKATATNTGNGLSLIGNISTGSQAITIVTGNGFRGTVANFASDLWFSFRQYQWRSCASSESRELGQSRHLPSRLSRFSRVHHWGLDRAGWVRTSVFLGHDPHPLQPAKRWSILNVTTFPGGNGIGSPVFGFLPILACNVSEWMWSASM